MKIVYVYNRSLDGNAWNKTFNWQVAPQIILEEGESFASIGNVRVIAQYTAWDGTTETRSLILTQIKSETETTRTYEPHIIENMKVMENNAEYIKFGAPKSSVRVYDTAGKEIFSYMSNGNTNSTLYKLAKNITPASSLIYYEEDNKARFRHLFIAEPNVYSIGLRYAETKYNSNGSSYDAWKNVDDASLYTSLEYVETTDSGYVYDICVNLNFFKTYYNMDSEKGERIGILLSLPKSGSSSSSSFYVGINPALRGAKITIKKDTLQDVNGYYNIYGKILKGASQMAVDVEITSSSDVISNVALGDNCPHTFQVIEPGEYTQLIRIFFDINKLTDELIINTKTSKGYTSTLSDNITNITTAELYPYQKPQITRCLFQRCNASGKIDESGTHLKMKYAFSFDELFMEDMHTKAFLYTSYMGLNTEEYPFKDTPFTSNVQVGTYNTKFGVATNEARVVIFYVNDGITTASKTVNIPKSQIMFSFKDGDGVAVGKLCDASGFEVDMNSRFNKAVAVKGTLSTPNYENVEATIDAIKEKVNKMYNAFYFPMPRTITFTAGTASNAYKSVSGSAHLLGSTMRITFSGTAKAAITAGNITNINVFTAKLDNSDGYITNLYPGNCCGGASGPLSQYNVSASWVDGTDKTQGITLTFTLAAIATNISAGASLSGSCICGVSVDMLKCPIDDGWQLMSMTDGMSIE